MYTILALAKGSIRSSRSRVKTTVVVACLGAVLVAGFLAYGRFIEKCNRIPCMGNLHEIGQLISLYANDHDGVTPRHIEDVLSEYDLNPVVFVCPYTSDRPPEKGKDAAERPGHHSYRYLTPGVRLADLSPETPIVIEDLANHDNRGANVLFGDGHSEWLEAGAYKQLLATMRAVSRPVTRRAR
jgi:prepilin-type processing-associated H-X9-DG protein